MHYKVKRLVVSNSDGRLWEGRIFIEEWWQHSLLFAQKW